MASATTPHKHVALALSGGGVRAAAHLGIVDVLRREGYAIRTIAGSSGGALVGALLCDGHSTGQIREIFKAFSRFDFVRHSRKGGVFSLDAVETLLEKHLSVTEIEALETECIIAATDLVEGKIIYFDKGPIARLATASSSLIPFFAPVRYGDMQLCDGGFMDNMPVRAFSGWELPVIGVNVNAIAPLNPSNVMQTTYRALVLMMASNVEASKCEADVYIEVKGCAGINIFDLSRFDEAYEAGVIEAERLLKAGMLNI